MEPLNKTKFDPETFLNSTSSIRIPSNVNDIKNVERIPKLVDSKSEIIHKALEPFNFNDPICDPATDPIDLAYLMIDAMRYYGGYGLSANQIGLPYRLFVINTEPVYVCYNPVITAVIDKTDQIMEEGCLTYPNLLIKVKRPNGVRVRFQDPYGNIIAKQFYGMTARVFQHELDHLNGLTILDRATSFHKEQALRKLKNARRKEKTRS